MSIDEHACEITDVLESKRLQEKFANKRREKP